jgi:hypothetical protein
MFTVRNRFQTRNSTRAARRQRLRARPVVQMLEDRTLLSFNAPLNLPTGGVDPLSVAVGDFTGRGLSDLVVTNKGFSDGTSRGVSVLLGNGDGTFQAARALDGGPSPFAVAVGDFDGDGTLDLAVTHAGEEPSHLNTVSILLGNGDGTFRQAEDLQVGTDPRSIAVADFNGDGHLDLVTANASSNTVSVLLGNGNGTFRPAVNLPVGSLPDAVAVGNFNGHLGIVTANEPIGEDGSVSLLLGNGDGTFQPAVTLGLGNAGSRPAARSIAVAALTGNGSADIVTANDSDNGGTVSVFLGNGDGTFQPAVTYPVVTAPFSNPLSLAVGDFHGNGRPDLIVGNVTFGSGRGNLDQLFLFAGNGDGSFQAPVAIDGGMLPIAMAVGHFTSDGNLDLAVANAAGGDVTILLGHGHGTFNSAPDFPAGAGAFSIAAGDFTGTGVLDLVTANTRNDTISILFGKGDGTFQAPVTYATGHLPESVAVADLTGNGIQDIIVASAGTGTDGTISVLLGNGDGTFQAPITFDPGLRFFFPKSVAVGEFDGDGLRDLAVSYDGAAGEAGILVLAGNGDGSFRLLNNLSFSHLSSAGRLAVADLNGDGTDDLVLPADSVNSGGVEVLLGDGHGGFHDVGFTATTVGGASAVAVGNFGNGFPDLAVTNFLSHTVSVLLGNGSGLFLQPPVNYTVGGNPRSVLVADVEGNGILDIITANSTGNTVSLLRGNRDGTFQAEIRYLTGSGTNAVVVGDFNGDGALDLATANGVSGNVSVLLGRNDGTGTRTALTSAHVLHTPRAAAVDALFAGTRIESLKPVVTSQQPRVLTSDSALFESRLDALTPQPAVVDADTLFHRPRRDRSAALDATGLDEALLEPL